MQVRNRYPLVDGSIHRHYEWVRHRQINYPRTAQVKAHGRWIAWRHMALDRWRYEPIDWDGWRRA
jgi:hypothetical protein